ncbi:cytochrome d ubiquinol oxidase subunit II [Hyphomicrobium methylovorum]|uniref:cytochrome d ubiquinol oxidase subunit II n=1 Tax=Hyphomicrobium methylovorum TaxID=84 RepID=UPI0015E783F0|nr:cytochrome d ubiquinol oxidase subunit II [Hyphomicrobium methylovorum]MBA2125989.1 cytochrome d ubiquinol oxidase subunit II [Hyphomicrobium methylovorum]
MDDSLAYALPLIWAAVLATAVTLYVVLDGFGLGLGILFHAEPREDRRDVMMNTIAPFWDGNQTWLVMGGGGLMAAFPKAYGVIMSGLYIPIIIMLLALVFRGVAFEFRWVSKPKHQFWDLAFSWGALVATFTQGVVLGGLLQGLAVEGNHYAGGTFDWLTPFSLFCGAALVAGYGLLGTTWLIYKTDGDLQDWARNTAKVALLLLVAATVVVSLWTPFSVPRIAERWFEWPNILLFAPVPLLTAYAAWRCWNGIENIGNDGEAFVSAVGIFLLGFVGLLISNVPYLVPNSMTVWEAAAAPSSQLFLLVGTLVLLPIILGYTVFVYWTFRGKVRESEGYH